MRKRERHQENCISNREDGRCKADAEGQRKDYQQRESWRTPLLAESKTKVLDEGAHRVSSCVDALTGILSAK